MLYNKLKYVYLLSVLLCAFINGFSNDTIVLKDDQRVYELKLANKDTLSFSDSVTKTLVVYNRADKEDWYFKCDYWKEVSVLKKSKVFIGGWSTQYKVENFFFELEFYFYKFWRVLNYWIYCNSCVSNIRYFARYFIYLIPRFIIF